LFDSLVFLLVGGIFTLVGSILSVVFFPRHLPTELALTMAAQPWQKEP